MFADDVARCVRQGTDIAVQVPAGDIFARERLGGSQPFAVVRLEQSKAPRHEGQADGRQPGSDLPKECSG
jgi:hypothetical protein